MAKMKAYEELEFIDDFLFGKIMSTNPEICRQITEYALGREVAEIRYTDTQKEIRPGVNAHGFSSVPEGTGMMPRRRSGNSWTI